MAGDRPMGEAAEEVGHDQAERQHALAEEEELEDGADDRQDDGVAIAQSVEDDERDGKRQLGGRRLDDVYHVQRAADVGVDPPRQREPGDGELEGCEQRDDRPHRCGDGQ